MINKSSIILKTFSINLIIQFCNLFTGIITARLLQPTGRGELATILLWPTMVAGFGILGVNWSLARAATEDPENEENLIKTSLVLITILSFFTISILYFILPRLLPSDKEYLLNYSRFFLYWIPLNFIGLIFISLDQARLRWNRFNLTRLMLVLPYLLIIFIFYIFNVNQVYWFAIALMVSNFIVVIFQLLSYRNKIVRGNFIFKISKTLLIHGLPFFIASVSATIAFQADKTLVVAFLPAEQVGCYAAAFAFASIHASLGGALGITSFATMANEPDFSKQRDFLTSIFRQATILYFVAGGGIALCAPYFIPILFGKQFNPAVGPASVLAGVTSFNALNNILNEGMRGRGKTAPGILAQLSGGGIMAIAAWFLAKKYALVGMAWAAMLGAMAQLAVMIVAVILIFDSHPAHFWGLRRREINILYRRVVSCLHMNWRPLKVEK